MDRPVHSNEDFVARLGRPFTAHRLRRLSELFLEGYAGWLPEIGVTAPARSLSTLLLLESGPLGASEIAARLRFSHPLMINLLASLDKAGFVTLERDSKDARRRPARLTAEGKAEVARVKAAVHILDAAYAELFAEVGADLEAIATRVEAACRHDSFNQRLRNAAAHLCQEEIQCD
jgi:DNA-binding MarR family transcriptional regulator